MRVYYGKAVYGKEEIAATIDVLKNKSISLIDGPSVKELEKKIAKVFGKKYGLMVNSGSSANLLGLASFNFKKGSEIITPTLTFSTTVSPIYQIGCVPHFIDVDKFSFLSNLNQIEKAINKKTVAIMLPNLLGNVIDWRKVYKIAKKYNLSIIEDSADTIGYTFKGKNFGKYSDISTNSLYASHVITGAGFGGVVCFNDKKNYERAKLLRGWGRSSAIFNESEGLKLRFNKKVDGIPYDGKYIFSELGYNFLPSEISAAFALVQLKKLKLNIDKRIENFTYLKNNLNTSNNFYIPKTYNNVRTGWLAFPLLLQGKLVHKRKDLQIFLEKRGIQTRTIFTGNIMRQPVAKKFQWDCFGSFEVSDEVMKSGILLGSHNRQPKENLDFLFSIQKYLF